MADTEKSGKRVGRLRRFPARVYQAVWRWHFWASLILTPILIVVSVTGALYVFKPQLEPLLYPELFQVEAPADAEPGSAAAGLQAGSFDAFEAAAARHLPDHHLAFISIFPDPERSWEGYARHTRADGSIENLRVFFDPYRHAWLGAQDYNGTLFRLILTAHRNLFAGLPGRLLVEVMTCWTIISVLTGIYLWWPRKRERFWGVWLPRIRGTRRQLWKDWHTVPGFYLSVILILVLVTGLLFTRVWGTAWLGLNAVTGGFPAFYTDPPHAEVPADPAAARRISIDQAYAIASDRYSFAERSHQIEVPKADGKDDHPFQIMTSLSRPMDGLRVVMVDSYRSDVLLAQSGEDLPWRTHLTLLFYPIHTGTIAGWPTQVLAVIACLALVGLGISGVWLWWNRRPPGKLAAPQKPADPDIPAWISWLAVALAVLLPTVGITLLAVLAGGWLWRRLRPATP